MRDLTTEDNAMLLERTKPSFRRCDVPCLLKFTADPRTVPPTACAGQDDKCFREGMVSLKRARKVRFRGFVC